MNNVVHEFQLNFGIYNNKPTWNTYLLINSSLKKNVIANLKQFLIREILDLYGFVVQIGIPCTEWRIKVNVIKY